jgi:hypothetical protein
MKKKPVKKKKVWPQTLSKKKLVEDFQYLEAEIDQMENEAYELKRECERRGIDPWKY